MSDFQKKKIGNSSEEDNIRIEKFDRGILEKKTVFLEIDDEVVAAYDRIKKIRGDPVTVVIPKHATLLRSVINLKILKHKLDDLDRKVFLMINDPLGKKLASQAGFEVLERTTAFKKEEKFPPLAYIPSSPKTPERPIKSAQQKTSISELLKQGKKVAFPIVAKIKEYFAKRRKKKKYATEFIIITPHKSALITLVAVSVFILAGIAYIALPGATIALQPASNRIEQPLNISLLDFETYQNELEERPEATLPSFRIRPPNVKKTFTYPATGKIFQGEHASGVIAIMNESPLPWPLVEQTRFQTEDGLVFRIQQAVTVPAGRDGKPGTFEAKAIADPFDANGQVVGERGNIPAKKFFLPGLKNPENQKKLYGISSQPMTGGFTKVIKTVSEDDVKSTTERVKKEMLILAQEELKRYLDAQNLERGTSLKLLDDSRTIVMSEPHVIIPEGQIGLERETFTAEGEIEISSIAVNERELTSLLRSEMTIRKNPGREILEIDSKSLTYKIFDMEENGKRIKLTATLRGIEQYTIDKNSEAGLQFLKKITDHVVGRDINEATFYIQNLPEIERVEVKSWPFWAPTLPTVPDHIDFEILSGLGEKTD